MVVRPSLLLVTDLTYPARGRRYGDEDTWLASRLRETFDLALCHPRDAVALMDGFDVVLVRNSGPVLHHREAHDAFRAAALERGTRVHNPLTGRGDTAGKQYLVDLTRAGEPVIATVDRVEDLPLLPRADTWVVKPKEGADSIGLRFLPPVEVPALLAEAAPGELLVQPRVDFVHEVSFYVVDDHVHYALHAPDPAQRWDLAPYEPTPADLDFVRRFVAWNTLEHGIQRVDACRTPDGGLLLVELEDLNPYLSLDLLDDVTREAFVAGLTASLLRLLDAPGR